MSWARNLLPFANYTICNCRQHFFKRLTASGGQIMSWARNFANSQTNGQIRLTQKVVMTMNSQRIATINVASTDGTFSSHRRRFMENKEKSRGCHLQASDNVGLFHNRNHGFRGRALARHPAKRQRSWQELAVRLARRQPNCSYSIAQLFEQCKEKLTYS